MRSPGGNAGGNGFVIARKTVPLGGARRSPSRGVALVVPTGAHELYSASKLQEQLDLLIESARSIVVDLTELPRSV